MALLRGSVIMGAYTMAARPAIALTGVQFCKAPWWSKKPFYLRNPPYTILSPHDGQIETRINFGKTAKAKAEKGFKEGLPATAANIRAAVKGYKAPSRMTPPYPSRIRRTVHTLAELEGLLKK